MSRLLTELSVVNGIAMLSCSGLRKLELEMKIANLVKIDISKLEVSVHSDSVLNTLIGLIERVKASSLDATWPFDSIRRGNLEFLQRHDPEKHDYPASSDLESERNSVELKCIMKYKEELDALGCIPDSTYKGANVLLDMITIAKKNIEAISAIISLVKDVPKDDLPVSGFDFHDVNFRLRMKRNAWDAKWTTPLSDYLAALRGIHSRQKPKQPDSVAKYTLIASIITEVKGLKKITKRLLRLDFEGIKFTPKSLHKVDMQTLQRLLETIHSASEEPILCKSRV